MTQAEKESVVMKKGWIVIRGFGVFYEQIASTLLEQPILKDFTLGVVKVTLESSKTTIEIIKNGFQSILPLIDDSNSELIKLSKIEAASKLLYHDLTYKQTLEETIKTYLSTEIATRLENAKATNSLNRCFEGYLYIKQKILTISRLIGNNALVGLDWLDKEYMEGNLDEFMSYVQDNVESAVAKSEAKVIKNGCDSVKRNKRFETVFMKAYTTSYKRYLEGLEGNNIVETILKQEEKLESLYNSTAYNTIFQWSIQVHYNILNDTKTLIDDISRTLNNLLTVNKTDNPQQRIERVLVELLIIDD